MLENARKWVVGLENSCGGLGSDSERLNMQNKRHEHQNMSTGTQEQAQRILKYADDVAVQNCCSTVNNWVSQCVKARMPLSSPDGKVARDPELVAGSREHGRIGLRTQYMSTESIYMVT